MIFLCWFVWGAIIIFNVVMLLNFLITFISETYEEVYGRDKIDDFKNMANMNYECRVIMEWYSNKFNKLKGYSVHQTLDYVIVTLEKGYQNMGSDDFLGVVQTLKTEGSRNVKKV